MLCDCMWGLHALTGGTKKRAAPYLLADKQKAGDKLHAAICATPAVAFEPQGGLRLGPLG